jgi:hypothetical protein
VVIMPEQHLVDEEVAAYVTGRTASTIRRWAAEGRLTRHGARDRRVRHSVLYDLLELPPAVRDDNGIMITAGTTPPVMSSSVGIVAA